MSLNGVSSGELVAMTNLAKEQGRGFSYKREYITNTRFVLIVCDGKNTMQTEIYLSSIDLSHCVAEIRHSHFRSFFMGFDVRFLDHETWEAIKDLSLKATGKYTPYYEKQEFVPLYLNIGYNRFSLLIQYDYPTKDTLRFVVSGNPDGFSHLIRVCPLAFRPYLGELRPYTSKEQRRYVR